MSDQIPGNPRRTAVQIPPRQSKTEIDKTPEEVIQSAPLRNTDDTKQEETEQPKPWRVGTSMSEDELMLLTEKTSINLPLEASLLVNYLVADKRVGGLGRKYTKTNFIVDAIMEKAKRELKKKGITY